MTFNKLRENELRALLTLWYTRKRIKEELVKLSNDNTPAEHREVKLSPADLLQGSVFCPSSLLERVDDA